MGNRAVITTTDVTKENANQKLGIYVHWHGSKEDIERALKIAKERKIRKPFEDYSYFWARFCQVFADMISEDSLNSQFESAAMHAFESDIGIDVVSELDCHNHDNGVYYINNDLEIEKQTDGSELE